MLAQKRMPVTHLHHFQNPSEIQGKPPLRDTSIIYETVGASIVAHKYNHDSMRKFNMIVAGTVFFMVIIYFI